MLNIFLQLTINEIFFCLETTQQELELVKKEKDEMERKKDDEIARLNRALENMDRQYRDILSVNILHTYRASINSS